MIDTEILNNIFTCLSEQKQAPELKPNKCCKAEYLDLIPTGAVEIQLKDHLTLSSSRTWTLRHRKENRDVVYSPLLNPITKHLMIHVHGMQDCIYEEDKIVHGSSSFEIIVNLEQLQFTVMAMMVQDFLYNGHVCQNGLTGYIEQASKQTH